MKRSWFSLSTFLFLLLFILPVVIVTIYEYSYATDRFESKASVFITEESSQSSPLDLTLLGITDAGSSRDILVLKAFIESQALLSKFDEKLGLRKHFSDPKADFLSRLDKGASREEYFEYYLNRVKATYDDEAQLLEFSVQTFDSEYSRKVLQFILKESQIFIDRLNSNVSSSQLAFFENEVKKSEALLAVEKKKLRDFQKENNFLSTEVSTQAIIGTISALEQQLAQRKSELASRQGILGENSPTLRRLRAEIAALDDQIAKANNRIASGKGGSLSELDAQFRDFTLLIEFKTLRYKANLDALAKAQVEAARRLRFLTIVSKPTLADESLYPDRPYIIITTALIALLIYFIVSITLATIREHA